MICLIVNLFLSPSGHYIPIRFSPTAAAVDPQSLRQTAHMKREDEEEMFFSFSMKTSHLYQLMSGKPLFLERTRRILNGLRGKSGKIFSFFCTVSASKQAGKSHKIALLFIIIKPSIAAASTRGKFRRRACRWGLKRANEAFDTIHQTWQFFYDVFAFMCTMSDC